MSGATYLEPKVRLVLPDGRKFDLPQAVAASGIRFTDGKIEFWRKGANAGVVLALVTIPRTFAPQTNFSGAEELFYQGRIATG